MKKTQSIPGMCKNCKYLNKKEGRCNVYSRKAFNASKICTVTVKGTAEDLRRSLNEKV
jgi:hypothetical protein